MLRTLARVMGLVLFVTVPLSAEVARIEVHSRADVVNGQAFGPAGPYEKLSGRIFFAVDPGLPANRSVTDLSKAPRNAAGKVEFSADFFLIKPRRGEKGNGAVLFGVSNRGGKGRRGFFSQAAGRLGPAATEQVGAGSLL